MVSRKSSYNLSFSKGNWFAENVITVMRCRQCEFVHDDGPRVDILNLEHGLMEEPDRKPGGARRSPCTE